MRERGASDVREKRNEFLQFSRRSPVRRRRRQRTAASHFPATADLSWSVIPVIKNVFGRHLIAFHFESSPFNQFSASSVSRRSSTGLCRRTALRPQPRLRPRTISQA